MGRLVKGILGAFSGKVGTVIGSKWKNIEYIRSLSRSSKSASPRQLTQRARFAVVSRFLNAIPDLVKITYQDSKNSMSGRNSALSHILKNAVAGEYPDLVLDFTQVLIAKGSLPNATAPHASLQNGKIRFEWTDNSGLGKAKPNDKAVLLLYSELLNRAVYTVTGPARNALLAELGDPFFSGNSVQAWIAFISADGKDVSPSVHLGQFLMP